MTCDQRQDLLLLYVSDALEADEAAELRGHLQGGCPVCAGHLAEAQALMASLPLALDPVMPPPGLKTRLMQRIDADSARSTRVVAADASNELQLDSLPIRLFRYLIPAAVAAGLAIVCTHYVMNRKVLSVQEQANAAIAQAREGNLQQALQVNQLMMQFQGQTQIVEMLEKPEVKLVHLAPTEYQPKTACANLLWDQGRQQWAILTSGMAPAARGQTYELWFVTDKGAFSAGVFDVDAQGRGSLQVHIPPGIGRLTTAAVTNEKAGGVSVPTGNFQVLAKLD